ncbi:class C sortase [Enterococcus sp. HY326]|uniref:class C sortase n=1 Tax=Enterococcus sp. HY326 TaxID=2971265 RepID=UPI0022405CE0|nr:class C sortase [Enterococcus sp. HY326]
MKKDASINFILKLLMAVLFLSGAAIFAYPFVVDSLNNFIDQQRITQYQKEAETNREEQAAKLAELQKKNTENAKTAVPGLGLVEDPFEAIVSKIENPDKSYLEEHSLGAIYIPAIKVSLPIFDETNETLLQQGATLLQGTSYPIGGVGNHSVITGHTGLAEKKLFTDLEKLKQGDFFYIDVLGERLAYEVMNIKKVEPTEFTDLEIVENKDLVTLLTCTPYGINSHRLLVTGSRIPYQVEMNQAIQQTQNYHRYRLVLIFLSILAFLSLFGCWLWRKIIFYRSASRCYNLRFFVKNKRKAIFLLTDRKGRVLPIPAAQQRINSQGEVLFTEIPGGKYWVALQGKKETRLILKAKIRKLADQEFTLKGKPKKYLEIKKGLPLKYLLQQAAFKQEKASSVRFNLLKQLGIGLIFFTGLLVACYPFYSDAVNNLIDQQRLARYHSQLSNEQEQLNKLAKVNQRLAEEGNNPDSDPFTAAESGSQTVYQKHLLGTISIPKISVEIPLFDTTSDSLLDIGATVLGGTSQPVGGINTHAVISAHRGLPQKKLFTDLPELVEGDVFVLKVLGEKLAYQVNQIETVLPDETESLLIVPGEDIVTLVTCTPYMINSHRLLVRGHRVPYTEEVATTVDSATQFRQAKNYLLVGFLIVVTVVYLYFIWRTWHNYLLRIKNLK